MRLRIALIVGALCAFAAVAPATDNGWVSLRLKEAGLVFEMPAKPKLMDRTSGTPITAYMLLTGEGLLMAGYSDALPFNTDSSGARKMLDDFDKGMTASAKLTPAGFRDVAIQGRQARVSVYQGEDGSYWRVVGVVHGDRIVFQLFIGKKEQMGGPVAARFFNSLKLEGR